jgi:hypothetical protein
MRFSRSAIFAVAALLGQSSLPAGSQPAEPTETWCRAHNFDPTAVSNCIEAEKRLLPKTAQKLPARPLPLPRPYQICHAKKPHHARVTALKSLSENIRRDYKVFGA